MTQAQPAGYQQLVEENAPDLAAMVGGSCASITEAGCAARAREDAHDDERHRPSQRRIGPAMGS